MVDLLVGERERQKVRVREKAKENIKFVVLIYDYGDNIITKH